MGLLTAGSNPFKSAIIGAAAGALVGGAVGSYMDKQEAKLRQQMAGTGVDVVRNGEHITLDMPGNVTFAFDSADLNGQFYPVLDKVAGTLKEYDKTVIEVAGAGARRVLDKGVPADLHPRVFPEGHAITGTLQDIPMLIWRTGPTTYRLLPRASFAVHVAEWLLDASRELRTAS